MGSGGRRVGASEDRRIDRMNVGGKRDAELAPLARRIGPRRCTLALERALTRSLRLLCLNASSALGSADMLASAVRVPPRLAGGARSEARGPAEKMDLSSMRPSKTLKPQGLRSLARVTGQTLFFAFFPNWPPYAKSHPPEKRPLADRPLDNKQPRSEGQPHQATCPPRKGHTHDARAFPRRKSERTSITPPRVVRLVHVA